MTGLLDTSVVVGVEQGRTVSIEAMPLIGAVSVVMLAELELGVRMAKGNVQRALRATSLRQVRDTLVVVDVDQEIASNYAAIFATARRAGRRAKAQDVWIAATARTIGVPVYTQDADFDHLEVDVVRV